MGLIIMVSLGFMTLGALFFERWLSDQTIVIASTALATLLVLCFFKAGAFGAVPVCPCS